MNFDYIEVIGTLSCMWSYVPVCVCVSGGRGSSSFETSTPDAGASTAWLS